MPQEEKKQIKTTTGILIILAAAVIIGGGAIGYFYAMSPTSWDYMGNRTAVHKNSNNTNTSNTNSTATADWKTYTNSTDGYSIKYPAEWTAGLGSSPTSLGIYLKNNGQTQIQIITDATTQYSNEALSKFATDYVTPKDKSTITGVTSYQISLADGYQELVTISDPASKGLWYFTKNSNNYYVFITSETTQSITLNNILSTFQFTQ